MFHGLSSRTVRSDLVMSSRMHSAYASTSLRLPTTAHFDPQMVLMIRGYNNMFLVCCCRHHVSRKIGLGITCKALATCSMTRVDFWSGCQLLCQGQQQSKHYK